MITLGNRIKSNYEDRYRIKLTRRTPVIIRLDGKAFHTFTKKFCETPFDENFNKSIVGTMHYLLAEIQGAKCGYTQSDEISILVTDFDKLITDGWFDYNLQKIVSVSAATASLVFHSFFMSEGFYPTVFDSRAFNIPKGEVCNYFIWRQNDWVRNSIQMLGRQHFSHKELHKKNSSGIHEMLHSKGVNWADMDEKWKNGTFMILKKGTSYPTFTKNRNIIEDLMIEVE